MSPEEKHKGKNIRSSTQQHQTRKSKPTNCKKTSCCNDQYIYKIKGCKKQDLQTYTVVEQRKHKQIDNMGQIYKYDLTFREENPSGKRKEDIFEKKILCEGSYPNVINTN